MTQTVPVKRRSWVADHLRKLPFVQWDRFTVADLSDHDDAEDGEQQISVYGWIDRQEDSYKDFVLLRFWPVSQSYGFTTSSDRYSERIYEILIDEEESDHNPCRRVEDAFDVENAIRLREDATLASFTEGSA